MVVAIASHTAIGAIHSQLQSQTAIKTPLKKKLDEFGDSLARVITVVCVLVWLINIRHFQE